MKKAFFPLLLLLITAGCGPTLKVTADMNKKADFKSYKSFALYNPAGQNSSISELNRDRIENGIVAVMIAKGYTQADTTMADLLVNPVIITKQKSNVTAYTSSYGYGGFYRPYYWGAGFGTTTFSVDDYIDGSLIIDVVDRQKKELLWQGIGNREIDGPVKDPDTKIPAAVKKIMESFPSIGR